MTDIPITTYLNSITNKATRMAGGDPEGAGDAVPLNNKREGVAPGTVGSHAPCLTCCDVISSSNR